MRRWREGSGRFLHSLLRCARARSSAIAAVEALAPLILRHSQLRKVGYATQISCVFESHSTPQSYPFLSSTIPILVRATCSPLHLHLGPDFSVPAQASHFTRPFPQGERGNSTHFHLRFPRALM